MYKYKVVQVLLEIKFSYHVVVTFWRKYDRGITMMEIRKSELRKCWTSRMLKCWKSRMLKCWESRMLKKQNAEKAELRKAKMLKCGKSRMLKCWKSRIQDMIGKSIVGKVIIFIRGNFCSPEIGHFDHCSLGRSWTECLGGWGAVHWHCVHLVALVFPRSGPALVRVEEGVRPHRLAW